MIIKAILPYSFIFSFLLSLLTCQNKKEQTNGDNNSRTAAVDVESEEIRLYREVVTHFLDSALSRTNFNGGILIAKNGNVVYEKYLGYKDIRTKDTLTAETPLQIASTTKTFTSAAILKLIQEGKLNLDDPLTNFFPGFPYAGVTVKTLLNHRSGLPNYLYYFEKNGWDKSLFIYNNDVVQTLLKWRLPPAFKANTRFNYSNTNYVVLASLVEKLSGMSFPEYMRLNFFDPLNMNNTYVFTINDTTRSPVSFNYNGTFWPLDHTDGTYGDKGIYSTPQDLLKWDQALYDGFVNKKLLDSAFIPYSNEKLTMHNYGLGWRILMFPNGKKVTYHNGRWHGFNSAFSRLTDEKVTIIMLVNKYNRNVYSLARRMYDLFGNYDGRNGALPLDDATNIQ